MSFLKKRIYVVQQQIVRGLNFLDQQDILASLVVQQDQLPHQVIKKLFSS